MTYGNRPILTFVDFRASDHCFIKREAFTNYIPYSTLRKRQAASKDTVFFKDALHTPDLLANFISIGKFDKAGFSVTFTRGKASFRDPEEREVLTGEGSDGISLISTLDTEMKAKAMIAAPLNIPVDLDRWHCCFGHASIDAIQKLVGMDLIDSLTIKEDPEVKCLCKNCIYEKHTSCSYNSKCEVKGHSNNCIYVDLWSPTSTPSIGEALYMMILAHCTWQGTS